MINSRVAQLPNLQKTFRWFGSNFGVSLNEIREFGVEGIVTACHHIPTGEEWPTKEIEKIQSQIQRAGMQWAVVESVNIHNAIKYAEADRDFYIENYIKTLRNLAQCGIKTVCYNFMPLIDWTRTNLNFELPTGAIALQYDPVAVAAFDLFILKRATRQAIYTSEIITKAEVFYQAATPQQLRDLEATILAGMPGSKKRISTDFFVDALQKASQLSKSDLQQNLLYFLKAIMPEAEKLGVNMALHPDDPPFPVFGIPRIASTRADFDYIFKQIPSISNGMTFCTGSLGATAANDLPSMVQSFGERIHFLHLRNVQREPDGSFYESAHLRGSVDMAAVMRAIVNEQLRRFDSNAGVCAIPMRPDHGHILAPDKSKVNDFYPGYPLVGRMIGLSEMVGLEMGVRGAFLQ